MTDPYAVSTFVSHCSRDGWSSSIEYLDRHNNVIDVHAALLAYLSSAAHPSP